MNGGLHGRVVTVWMGNLFRSSLLAREIEVKEENGDGELQEEQSAHGGHSATEGCRGLDRGSAFIEQSSDEGSRTR